MRKKQPKKLDIKKIKITDLKTISGNVLAGGSNPNNCNFTATCPSSYLCP